ncbi:hypothetical protein Glove_114g52 [Diversispora epigaea]|uniref:Uncharacterized protein n=1 Tax=Diversispora epigaea TaxID=1348612 RepID=A0A397J1H3_9GLOM|nr:hypothetical protein Glove_114g52 [Diversispora epigaea]
MVAITPIFGRENAIPLTTGKVLLLQIIPHFMERKSGEFNIVILWNLDFGHDDSDNNDGDDDNDDDDDDGDDGEVSGFGGYLVVFFVIICWDVMTGLFGYRLCWMAERYYDGFIWLSFMLGRQKDIMMGLLGYRLCWDGRKIL